MYKLIGGELSPYTAKVRLYLRYKKIPFEPVQATMEVSCFESVDFQNLRLCYHIFRYSRPAWGRQLVPKISCYILKCRFMDI